MARVSFTLRRPSTDADLGSYLRYDDALGARTDYDSALRADGLQTAPAAFVTSSFSATSVCYGEAELSWEVPLVAVEDLTATPDVTGVVLVYSAEGEPATIASGTILVESTDTFSYSHHGLMEGRWAYYSLFVHYQSTGGDSYYEKVASLGLIIPKDYGSTAQLWKRIPEYYRNQDTLLGDLDYDAACLGSVITSSSQTVGPLLKFLSVFGFELDRMRTLLDYQMVAYDPALANSEHLDALSEQLGVDLLSSALGSRRLRTLLNDIGVFRRSKGTPSSIEFFGQAIAGSDMSIDQTTGEVTIYSQRVNYITDPVDGESVTTTRPATVLEETAPIVFANDPPSGYLKNLGTGGSALDARFGSTTGSDTNDPTLVPHTGTNYMYLPGAGSASNYASIPDAADLDITGDIEVVLRLSANDWTPASAQGAIASRQTLVDPNRAWQLRHLASGTIGFHWYPTGSGASVIAANSTVPAPWADGSIVWLKSTLDVDNGAGGWTVRFWYAADQATEPSSWTQLGADVTGAGVTSLPAITSPLYVGLTDGTTTFAGGIYRAIVRNGIGGTTVFDADFTTGITSGGQTSFTATTGQTVTINRATSGRTTVAVTRPLVSFTTDDYLEVPDSALLNFGATDSFTVLAVARQWKASPTGSNARLLTKNGTGPGYRLYMSGTGLAGTFQVSDGTASPVTAAGAAFTQGTLRVAAGVRNVDTDVLQAFDGTTWAVGASDTTTTTLTNTSVLRIGSESPTASAPWEGEFLAAAVFRRALTAAEIGLINTHYTATPTTASMALLAEAVFWVDAGLSYTNASLNTYSVVGNEYTLLPSGTTLGATHALFHLTDPIPIQLSDRVGFSVQSNAGTDGIKWVRLVNSAGASVGLQDTALTVDGARIFEVTAESNASVGVWTDVYVEYLVDLSAVPTFINGALLAERNFLGTYFDGSTVRGGWLVDSSSVSDYRWEGTANASRSLFTEDYQRTKSVVQDLFYDTLPITEESKYTIIAYNAVPGVPVGL